MVPLALTHLLLRTPDRLLRDATVVIADGRFVAVGEGLAPPAGARVVPLPGHAAVPGLVNGHDHLVGCWAPRFGHPPYRNVYGWIADYHPSAVRAERDRVPHAVVARLGGYRNLLSGVTFVAEHHRRGQEAIYAGLPIAMFADYGREWVVRSARDPAAWPPWGAGIAAELASAERADAPFLIHVGEGLDDEARGELAALVALGGLTRRTVLVHALALGRDDPARIAAAGAAVIWCPSSNHFLYGATTDPQALRAAGVRVGLGTDSPMSGGPDFLAEIRAARTAWRTRYGTPPAAADLLRLATADTAAALGLAGRRGVVQAGAAADLVVFAARGADPADDLPTLDPPDLDLVLAAGQPVSGRPVHRPLFEAGGRPFTALRHGGRPRLVDGDPLALLAEVARALGKPKSLPFLDLAPA